MTDLVVALKPLFNLENAKAREGGTNVPLSEGELCQYGGHVMALSEARDSISLSSLKAGGFLASESKRIGTITEMQKELLDTFEQFNRAQLAHVKREMDLASEFVGKVTAARSVPDVMGAYQVWVSRRMAFFAEDGGKLFQESQRVVNATMKLLVEGPQKGQGA